MFPFVNEDLFTFNNVLHNNYYINHTSHSKKGMNSDKQTMHEYDAKNMYNDTTLMYSTIGMKQVTIDHFFLNCVTLGIKKRRQILIHTNR